ncbi:MAG: hypothetical protein NC191_02635 [Muribaculaceae bacterium]|nr:hypothetical protein [Muribaculaceae bacterium]
MNNNISFQSRIRIIGSDAFMQKVTKRRPRSVDYPWTIRQTVFDTQASTTKVYDCTAMGINDGENVLLFHICPTEPRNKNLDKIKEFVTASIKEKLNPQALQGFILGGKKNNINSPKSINLFCFLEDILKELNIPYSKFKGGEFENHVYYNSTTDEWLIGNSLLDDVPNSVFGSPKNALNKIFDEVNIAQCDEVTW